MPVLYHLQTRAFVSDDSSRDFLRPACHLICFIGPLPGRSMSDIQLYLVEAEKDKDEARNIAAQSAARLATGDLRLLQLIEACGDYINSDEPRLRKGSLAYLADVLAQLPPKVLTLQQRSLLCQFVLSRVRDDIEGTASCANSLIALEERGKWDQDTAAEVAKTCVSLFLRRVPLHRWLTCIQFHRRFSYPQGSQAAERTVCHSSADRSPSCQVPERCVCASSDCVPPKPPPG